MIPNERRLWSRNRCAYGRIAYEAYVRPGREVQVLELSPGGALIEGRARLRPESQIDLRLSVDGRAIHVRGRVVRCYVSALTEDVVSYQAGIAFVDKLDLAELHPSRINELGRKCPLRALGADSAGTSYPTPITHVERP